MQLTERLNSAFSNSSNQIRFKFLNFILTIFIFSWLLSNIAATKIINILGVHFTGGFFIFPFTMMLGSIIAEVYGYKNARKAIWLGVVLNLSYIFVVNCIYLISDFFKLPLESNYWNYFLPGRRVALASCISFLVSEFINCYLMAKLKIFDHGKSLFKRILISCVLSYALDITVFLTLAFYGVLSNSDLIFLICVAYSKKVICQLLLFPAVIYFSTSLKKMEAVNIFDHNTNFNPFSFENVYELPQNAVKKINLN